MSRINRAPQTQLTGVDRTLQPAQVIVPPPVSDNALLLGQLARALEVTGDTAGEYSAYQGRLAAERRRVDADAKELHAGQGSLAGRSTLATLQSKIDQRDPLYDIPDGMEPQQWAQHNADAYTAGMPDAFKKSFEREFVPGFIHASTNSQERRVAEMFAANDQLRVAAVGSAQSADEIDQIVDSAKAEQPNRSIVDIYDANLRPALKIAAAANDPDRVKMIKERLGAYLQPEQQEADLSLRHAALQAKSANEQQYDDDLGSLELQGASFEAREAAARGMGNVGPEKRANAVEKINSQRRQGNIRAEVQGQRQQWEAENDALVGGGLGATIQNKTFVDSNGTEHKLGGEEGYRDSMDRHFARILAAHRDQPALAFAYQVRLANDNGYAPPQWRNIMQAGAAAASESGLTGGDAALPPTTPAGYGMFRQLMATNPGLLEVILPDGPARDYYETTAILQEDGQLAGEAGTNSALLGARRIMTSPTRGRLSDLSVRDIETRANDLASSFFGGKANNWTEVAGQIRRRALVYARAGMAPDLAVERAGKQLKGGRVDINGWSQPTANARIPADVRQQLPKLAETIIGDWAKTHGKEDGFAADDLTLRAGSNNGFWVVAHGDTGLPVNDHGEQISYSTADLVKRYNATNEAARLKAEAERVAANAEALRRASQRHLEDAYHDYHIQEQLDRRQNGPPPSYYE